MARDAGLCCPRKRRETWIWVAFMNAATIGWWGCVTCRHKVSNGHTGRYATAPNSALLAAADRVALRIAEILDSQEVGATVVSITAVVFRD